MNIEGWLCRHAVTSSVTSSSWKIFSRIIGTWSFHFWYLIGAILNRYNFCKVTKFWGRGELFRQNCHRKYVISTGKPMALPTFWAIDRTCSSKIDGIVAISKFGLFFAWWPSSMTYLFVNVTYWNCSPIPYVDQVQWWYVKAFMSYAWQKLTD